MSFRSRVAALSAGQLGTVWAGVVVLAVVAAWQHGAVAERAERYSTRQSAEVLRLQRELEESRHKMAASKAVADDARRSFQEWAEMAGSRLFEERARGALASQEEMLKTKTEGYRNDSMFVANAVQRLQIARNAHNRSVEERAQLAEYVQSGLTTLVILLFAFALALTWTWFGARKVSSDDH